MDRSSQISGKPLDAGRAYNPPMQRTKGATVLLRSDVCRFLCSVEPLHGPWPLIGNPLCRARAARVCLAAALRLSLVTRRCCFQVLGLDVRVGWTLGRSVGRLSPVSVCVRGITRVCT